MQASALNALRTLVVAALMAASLLADAQTNVASLITDLRSPDPGVRDHAAQQLGQTHSQSAIKPLIAALVDTNVRVAEDAAESLGQLRSVEAVQPLIDALDHSYCNGYMGSNRKAAMALSAIGMPAVPAIIASLEKTSKRDGNGGDASLAIALDGIDAPSIVSALAPLLQSGNPELRAYILQRLAVHPGSNTIDATLPLLDDPNKNVRLYAIRVLGANLNDSRVVPALRKIVEDLPDQPRQIVDLKISAMRQLARLHDPALLPLFISTMQYSDLTNTGPAGVDEVIDFGPVSIPMLIAALQDDSRPAMERGGAALALGHFDDPRVIAPLLSAAKDQSKSVRKEMMQGKIVGSNPAFTGVLIEALRNDTWARIRQLAAMALEGHNDPRVNPALVAALSDQDENVRAAAAASLGRRRATDAVDALLHYMQGPTTLDHQAGVEALGEIGDPRAIGPLIHQLAKPNSGDCYVVGTALKQLLTKITDPDIMYNLRQTLAQSNSSHCGPALELLAHDPASVKQLVDHLDEARPGGGNSPAYEGLDGSNGSPAVEPVIAALSSPNATVRANAAKVLSAGQRPGALDPRAIDPLLHALDDPNEEVRRNAAMALVNLDDPRKIDAFSRQLRSTDFAMREYAAAALGQVRDPGAVAAMITALDDPDSNTRRGLMNALQHNAYAPVLPALLSAIHSRNPIVRAGAAEALRYRTEREVTQALVVLEHDPDASVREAAQKALSGCPPPPMID